MSPIELYGKEQNPKAAYVKLLSSLKGKKNQANLFLVVMPCQISSSS